MQTACALTRNQTGDLLVDRSMINRATLDRETVVFSLVGLLVLISLSLNRITFFPKVRRPSFFVCLHLASHCPEKYCHTVDAPKFMINKLTNMPFKKKTASNLSIKYMP